MTDTDFEDIVKAFAVKFNEMCQTERKDFLIREKLVTYESGSEMKRYGVTYEVKKSGDVWKVDAVSDGFWIFKSRFPLLEVHRKESGMATLKGMYTKTFGDFEEALLEEKLEAYMAVCKALPQDAFIKS